MPQRRLTEADRAVWAAFAAQLTGSAKPLPQEPVERPVVVSKPVVAARVRARLMPLTINVHPGGLDKASWQRFRSGNMPVGRRLDLHGTTVQRAHDRFIQLVSTAAAQNIRCIEVITGRGSGEGGGVLRRELPLWINLPGIRPLILAASHPHAANDGAVRLLLRR